MHELTRDMRVIVDAATGATSVLNGTIVDMTGWESVAFIAFATATSTAQFLHMEMGTATNAMEDVVGDTSHTEFTNILDVYRPQNQFVRGVFTASGASSPYRALVTIQYGGRNLPATQNATVNITRLYNPTTASATGLATA